MAVTILTALLVGACCNPGMNCSVPPPSAYNNTKGGP